MYHAIVTAIGESRATTLVEDVMDLPCERLCQLALHALPAHQRADHRLKRLRADGDGRTNLPGDCIRREAFFMPQPLRGGMHGEQPLLNGINEVAQTLMQQMTITDDQGFLSMGDVNDGGHASIRAECHALRAAVYEELLRELREGSLLEVVRSAEHADLPAADTSSTTKQRNTIAGVNRAAVSASSTPKSAAASSKRRTPTATLSAKGSATTSATITPKRRSKGTGQTKSPGCSAQLPREALAPSERGVSSLCLSILHCIVDDEGLLLESMEKVASIVEAAFSPDAAEHGTATQQVLYLTPRLSILGESIPRAARVFISLAAGVLRMAENDAVQSTVSSPSPPPSGRLLLVALFHVVGCLRWTDAEAILELSQVMHAAKCPPRQSSFSGRGTCRLVPFTTHSRVCLRELRQPLVVTEDANTAEAGRQSPHHARQSISPAQIDSEAEDEEVSSGTDDANSREDWQDRAHADELTLADTYEVDPAVLLEHMMSQSAESTSVNAEIFARRFLGGTIPTNVVTSYMKVSTIAAHSSLHLRLRVIKSAACKGVRIVIRPVVRDSSTEDVIPARCVVPHTGLHLEYQGPCDVLIFCLNEHIGNESTQRDSSTTVPRLLINIETTNQVQVDDSLELEWEEALFRAQFNLAEVLLAELKGYTDEREKTTPGHHPFSSCTTLLRKGFQPSGVEVVVPLVEHIRQLDSRTIQRQVRCRERDAEGARAVLLIVAHHLCGQLANEGATLIPTSATWMDVLRRMSRYSAGLGAYPHAAELAQFVITRVEPCPGTVSQLMDGAVQLVKSQLCTADQVEKLLRQRQKRAAQSVSFLHLLKHASQMAMHASSFHHIPRLLKSFLLLQRGHYLSPLEGSGEAKENEVRQAVQELLQALFIRLRGVMEKASKLRSSPQWFILNAWEWAPFAVLTVSLLAAAWDAEDVAFMMAGDVATQVMSMLPNFSDFTRTSSFSVSDDGEEAGFMSAVLDYVAEEPEEPDAAMMALPDDRGQPLPSSRTAPPLRMMSIRQEGLNFGSGQGGFGYSEEPIIFYSGGINGGCSVSSVEVTLHSRNDTKHFVFGLASPALCRKSPDVSTDARGLYYLASGELHHKLESTPVPPLEYGSTLTMTFRRAVTRWHVGVYLNHHLLANFVCPRTDLYLVVGHTAGGAKGCSYRGLLRPPTLQPHEVTSAIAAEALSASSTRVANRLSFYNLSLFTTEVVQYLMQYCTRMEQSSRIPSGGWISTSAANSPLLSSAGESDSAMHLFVDRSCSPLMGNVRMLLQATQDLPEESGDSTERVKRQTALWVYDSLIFDYTVALAASQKCTSSPTEVLETLSTVAMSARLSERTRLAALKSVLAAIRFPNTRGFGIHSFDPTPLWRCCEGLAADAYTPGYRPLFTPQTVAHDMVVLAGGRRIEFAATTTKRPSTATTSYAYEAIPLDGSMGDEVSFSVRLQRGFSVDSLGRLYYVGLAFRRQEDTVENGRLIAYPEGRLKQDSVFALTDYAADAAEKGDRAELERHRANWVLPDNGAVFGSGDVVTVRVHCRSRSISFERNGKPLGRLFKNIPPSVPMLFPFVELYNHDSSAKWMYPLRELSIVARQTMRAMLDTWMTTLKGPMQSLLSSPQQRNTALKLLGADGDELAAVFRPPPRCDALSGIQNVRILQFHSRMATVEDSIGAIHRVCAAALEADNSSTLPSLNESCFLPDVMRLVREMVTEVPTTTSGDEVGNCIDFQGALLRALRLLSEAEQSLGNHLEEVCELTQLLLYVLRRLNGSKKVTAAVALREAWNEITWTAVGAPCRWELRQEVASGETSSDGASPSTLYDDLEKAHGMLPHLMCPTCWKEWGACTAQHEAPASWCVLYDSILRQAGLASPYTSWFATWTSVLESPTAAAGNEEVRPAANAPRAMVTFSPSPSGDKVTATGEMKHGRFALTGRVCGPNYFQGRVTFDMGKRLREVVLEDLMQEWSCSACTFANPGGTTRCSICETARPGTAWTCPVCRYAYNPTSATLCATCGQAQEPGRRITSTRRAAQVCSCETCGTEGTFTHFTQLLLHQHCERCGVVTQWLPRERIVGQAEAHLVGDGDQLLLVFTIDGGRVSLPLLRTDAFDARTMLECVERVTPEKGGGSLHRFVPPLFASSDHALASLTAPSHRPKSRAATSSSYTTTAIVYYASHFVFRWGPLLLPETFISPSVLTQLKVFDKSWMQQLKDVRLRTAINIVHGSLRMLFNGVRNADQVDTLFTVARVLIHSFEELRHFRHYLLYGLSLSFSRLGVATAEARETYYSCLNDLFEDYPTEFLQANCLGSLLRLKPQMSGQTMATIHALLHRLSIDEMVGSPSAHVVACLVRSVVAMQQIAPQPAVMLGNVHNAFPSVVSLAETSMTEGGELRVGQVRGSVGVAPTKGGHYYFEVVLPPNFSDGSTIVMGWGTLLHEQISSGQHVGNDLHSWGYNCQDRLRIMGGEQVMPVTRAPAAGDVIGSMMNLEDMMVCWTINGEEIMWISVPAQGESEEIFPYVSASVEPFGVLVRLTGVQYKPDGYEEYGCRGDALQSEVATVQPQGYPFYKELSSILDYHASGADFNLATAAATFFATDQAQRALTHYPLLGEFFQKQISLAKESTGNEECPEEMAARAFEPYVSHLLALGELTVMVARAFGDTLDVSTYLSGCVSQAMALVLRSARWRLFESNLGLRPSFSNNTVHQVVIDLERAKTASASPSDSLKHTVTYQLFSQIERAPIYKNAVMFSVRLSNDVTIDAGGVTRSVLTSISEEISFTVRGGAVPTREEPVVPLFKLCSHSTVFTVVPNMDVLSETSGDPSELPGVANPRMTPELARRLWVWLGMLLGNIVLCGTMKLTLTFPRLVWKFLCFTPADMDDYLFDVDDAARGTLDDPDCLLDDAIYFALPGMAATSGDRHLDGQPAELSIGVSQPMLYRRLESRWSSPVASAMDLALDEAEDAARTALVQRRREAAEHALIHQYDPALLAIRQGLTSVLCESSLRSIRWDDLQSRVCGSPCMTTEYIMSFMDCTSITPEAAGQLSSAVELMDISQRSQFLLFCSGQSRLPLPEKVHVTVGDEPNKLPTAHTCSPISLRLQPYGSGRELLTKLEICLSQAKMFGYV